MNRIRWIFPLLPLASSLPGPIGIRPALCRHDICSGTKVGLHGLGAAGRPEREPLMPHHFRTSGAVVRRPPAHAGPLGTGALLQSHFNTLLS